jgi:hypothetical protein
LLDSAGVLWIATPDGGLRPRSDGGWTRMTVSVSGDSVLLSRDQDGVNLEVPLSGAGTGTGGGNGPAGTGGPPGVGPNPGPRGGDQQRRPG